MKRFYRNLVQLLSAGEHVVVATVLHSTGSSSAGAKMMIRTDGSIIGTVGGGRLEAEIIKLAKHMFVTRQSLIHPFNLTGSDVAMSCGGAGEIWLDYIDAGNSDNKQMYEAVLSTLETAQKAWLITELKDQPAGSLRQQCLVKQDGTVVGHFQCEPEFMEKLVSGPAKISIHADANDGQKVIVEPIRIKGVVYLFGAGHVSQQIAKLTSMVGFVTVVIDDRPEFANKERFPQSEVVVVEDFNCMSQLSIDQDSYLVIATRGHLYDYIVLEQALQTEAAYIGMLGSKKKRADVFRRLQAKGVSLATLEQVRTPIGIDICAETPEEIAVSIVAELIKTRAERETCATSR